MIIILLLILFKTCSNDESETGDALTVSSAETVTAITDSGSEEIPASEKSDEEELSAVSEMATSNEEDEIRESLSIAGIAVNIDSKDGSTVISYPEGISDEEVEAFDYSMPSLVVSASGENDITSDDIRWYRNLEERIAKEQRRLSRMQYGSANYWEQKHRIGKLHEKASARRKDFLHKLSRKVSDTFDAVVVEDINLHHMSKAMNFGKSVYDNGYGMLRNMLSYKLKDKGKVLVKVDKFFPSSKRCSACHEINHGLKLSDRQWTCKSCDTHHDRDKNSCKNLPDEGKDILCRWASGESSLYLTSSGVLSEKKLHSHAHSNVRQDGE